MAQLCMGLVHAMIPVNTGFYRCERMRLPQCDLFAVSTVIFYAEAQPAANGPRGLPAISLNRLVEDAYAVHLNPVIRHQQTNLWDQQHFVQCHSVQRRVYGHPAVQWRSV